MAIPLRLIELDTLGDLGAALEDRFGPGIEAVIVVRRSDAPRWSSPRELPQPELVVRPVAERVVTLIGVPPSVNGYRYLVECLVLLGSAPPARHQVTTGLYPHVVTRCGARNWQAVERAIRHALTNAKARHPSRFGLVADQLTDGTTNARVIYRLLQLVADDLRGGRG